jgi:transposase
MVRIKKKDYERLDDATICRVVSLLNQKNSITKKAACEILNITYNTTRLNRIIQEYKDKIEYTKKRLKANKGRSFDDLELKELVTDYLNGISITVIAERLFRSVHVIKKKIQELNLPERTIKSDYFNPELIPDEAVSETFNIGELVWSARYNCVAEIRNIYKNSLIYSIWLFGKHNQFAYQPAEELGKLEVVKRFNLTADKFVNTEKPNFNYRID